MNDYCLKLGHSRYAQTPGKSFPLSKQTGSIYEALSNVPRAHLYFFFFPIIVSVACPTGPHPPLRLARRPNRGHIGKPSRIRRYTGGLQVSA